MGTAAAVVGGSLISGVIGAKGAKSAATKSSDASRYAADLQDKQYQQNRDDLQPYRERGVENLNRLSQYGRSQVEPGDYIPGSNIPQYQGSQVGMNPNVSGNIPNFDVTGNVSDFSGGSRQADYQGQNFDITKDPSYQFRQDEQERAINRNMGAAGKITSGNRLEEIMKRSGQMASQEYGAADARNVRDFGLDAGVNRENYGRDTGEFGLTRGVEDARYGRDLTGYDARRQNEQQQYGRDVGDYGRGYAQNVDQYGRDLTAFNADTAREQQQYGRGVDAYGRAYGQEGDYLNRLAALSNIGQSATNQTGNLGAAAAANQGNALVAAGNAQAAGQIGKANAWQQGIGDLTSLAGRYDPNMTSVNTNYNANFPTLPSWGGK